MQGKCFNQLQAHEKTRNELDPTNSIMGPISNYCIRCSCKGRLGVGFFSYSEGNADEMNLDNDVEMV